MQERLNRLYEQYGYRKFKMSRFEDYDLYAQNRDFLRQDRIITFTDADGALKALKPDITLSIIKNNSEEQRRRQRKGVLQRERLPGGGGRLPGDPPGGGGVGGAD